MTLIRFTSLCLFLLCSSLYGQELVSVSDGRLERTTQTVTKTVFYQLNQELSTEIVGGQESAPVVSVIKLVSINTESDDLLVSITDKDRNDCRSKFKMVNPRLYAGNQKGTYWFRVTDFDAKKEQEIKLTIGEDVTPPPPEPPGPVPPDPPSPDVKNEYGVGKISFESAPSDNQNLEKFAVAYRQQAEMLFGRPRLITINQALANLETLVDNRTCIDQQSCVQWGVWKTKLDAAVSAEQQKRGFLTGQQWYGLLIEVAESLEAK